jgi:hypothetical protein
MLYLLRPIGGFLYVDEECIEINKKKPHPLCGVGLEVLYPSNMQLA